MSIQTRQPAGIPTGGQFAATEKAEAGLSITDLPADRDAMLACYYEPIALDEYVVSPNGRVRVGFTDVGEGIQGSYDENDPEDEPLLRMDVQVRSDSNIAGDPVSEEAKPGDADYGWSWIDSSATTSFCTNVNADKVTGVEMASLCTQAALDFSRSEEAGAFPSGYAETYSHVSIDDAYVV